MTTTTPPRRLFIASQVLVFMLAFALAFTVTKPFSWIVFFSVWAILFLLNGWAWSLALSAYDKLREW